MNPLLEKLHDIEGLDPASFFPLATGWWILFSIGLILLLLLIVLAVLKIIFLLSWKNEALKKLNKLQTSLSDDTARQTIVLLSEYLRRIALKTHSRKTCASLTGVTWLQWLKTNDPKKFDWELKGTPLIEVPYAPLNTPFPKEEVKELIEATKRWII